MEEGKSLKSFCSNCKTETNHSVLHKETKDYNTSDYHCKSEFMIIECKGCEEVSYRTDFHDYESSYPDRNDNWTYDIDTSIFPKSLKGHVYLSHSHILPRNIRTVYEEGITAFTSGCFLLTAVAFRAVIEAVCLDKKIAGRNLEIKINNLSKGRLITEKEAQRLHSIRFIGNDSIHEMSVPKESSLYIVLDIIEQLLKNIYIIDHRAKNELETVISSINEFEELLDKQIQKFKLGDEYPLAKYFEKNIRRLNGQLDIFETQLMDNIRAGKYQNMSLGKKDNFGDSKEKLQHFKIIRIFTEAF